MYKILIKIPILKIEDVTNNFIDSTTEHSHDDIEIIFNDCRNDDESKCRIRNEFVSGIYFHKKYSTEYYSAAITPAGHPASQAPQSIQVSASITYLSSPAEIAPTGHVSAQAPHIKHPSLITCAMIKTSFLIFK